MHRLILGLASALIALAPAGAPARAADAIVVTCSSTPDHPDCGHTEHFKVDDEAEGKAAFAKLRAELFDENDPVARILATTKWGKPGMFSDAITQAFFYPLDKARCVYAEAERVFYGEEAGPIEEGTNENTARAVIYYLGRLKASEVAIRGQGVFHGADRLFLIAMTADVERLRKDWESLLGEHCKAN